MKKIAFISFLILFSVAIFAQEEVVVEEETSVDIKARFGNIKTLKSEQEEEVKIEIRKPDDSSIMPRKQTDFEYLQKRDMEEKLKKSNRMLY